MRNLLVNHRPPLKTRLWLRPAIPFRYRLVVVLVTFAALVHVVEFYK